MNCYAILFLFINYSCWNMFYSSLYREWEEVTENAIEKKKNI